MKTKIYILVLVFLAIMGFMNAQTEAIATGTATPGNSEPAYWSAYADKLKRSAAEKHEFLTAHQKKDMVVSNQAGLAGTHR